MCVIVVLGTAAVTIRLLYQLNIPESANINKKIKILTTACITTAALSVVYDSFHVIYCTFSDEAMWSHLMKKTSGIGDFFYYCSSTFFYSLAMYKVYITFRNTYMHVSHKLLYFYVFTVTTSTICAIIYVCIVFSQPADDKYFQKHAIPVVIVSSIVDLVINITLIVQFSLKLRATVVSFENTYTDYRFSISNNHNDKNKNAKNEKNDKNDKNDTVDDNIDNQEKHEKNKMFKKIFKDKDKDKDNHIERSFRLSNHSHSIMQVITTHTLLFGIAVITNQLFFVSNIIWMISSLQHNLTIALRMWELLLNIFILWLAFPLNRTFYFEWCKTCHNMIQSCFEQQTQYSIKMLQVAQKQKTIDEIDTDHIQLELHDSPVETSISTHLYVASKQIVDNAYVAMNDTQ